MNANLERKIIYLSTYVKFILLAYSVFLKNKILASNITDFKASKQRWCTTLLPQKSYTGLNNVF